MRRRSPNTCMRDLSPTSDEIAGCGRFELKIAGKPRSSAARSTDTPSRHTSSHTEPSVTLKGLHGKLTVARYLDGAMNPSLLARVLFSTRSDGGCRSTMGAREANTGVEQPNVIAELLRCGRRQIDGNGDADDDDDSSLDESIPESTSLRRPGGGAGGADPGRGRSTRTCARGVEF